MVKDSDRRPAQWPLAVGAVLLGVSQIVFALVPVPPSQPSDVLRWAEEHRLAMQVSSELLMFSSPLLLAGIVSVLMRDADALPRAWYHVGLAAFVLAVVVNAVTAVTQGRLLYPIFGIALTPDSVALMTSLVYSIMHAAVLLFAAGVIITGFQRRPGKMFRAWSLGVGVLLILSSFPWLTPAWINVSAGASLMGWFLTLQRTSV